MPTFFVPFAQRKKPIGEERVHMKTLHYNGLDRNGRRQYLVFYMTELEAKEWIQFGIENNITILDDTWPMQKKVQKILDAYYAKEYNQDRKEFYYRNSLYSKIENIQDEKTLSPLDILVEKEEKMKGDKELEIFLQTLTNKQKTRFQKYLKGMKIEEIAREEGVHHSSVSETIRQVQDKISKKNKKF